MRRAKILLASVFSIILITLAGFAYKMDWVVKTVAQSHEPEIAYIIFLGLGVGCVLAIMNALRIYKETDLLVSFFNLWALGTPDGRTQANLKLENAHKSGKSDLLHILDYVSKLDGKPPSAIQHDAIEGEIERFHEIQLKRLSFLQYLVGVAVGLGLLGTFLGLLGALAEIGKMIGSFAMGGVGDDPTGAITTLVSQLVKPMDAMAVAFVASLFGVLTSLILGLLVTPIRGAVSDLTSHLKSSVAISMDFGASGDDERGLLSNAELLSESLRNFSTDIMTTGKMMADVSTRFDSLMGGMEEVNRVNGTIVSLLQRQLQNETGKEELLNEMRRDFRHMLEVQNELLSGQRSVVAAVDAQQAGSEQFLATQEELFQAFAQDQQQIGREQRAQWSEFSVWFKDIMQKQEQYWTTTLSRNEGALTMFRKATQDAIKASADQLETSGKEHRDIMAMQRKLIVEQSSSDRAHWEELFQKVETALTVSRKRHEEQVENDRLAWQEQFQSQQDVIGVVRKSFVDRADEERETIKQMFVERQQALTDAIKAVQSEANQERNAWSEKGGQLVKLMGTSQESLQTFIRQVSDSLTLHTTKVSQIQQTMETAQSRLVEINEQSMRYLTLIADSIKSDSVSSVNAQRQIEQAISRMVEHNTQTIEHLAKAVGEQRSA